MKRFSTVLMSVAVTGLVVLGCDSPTSSDDSVAVSPSGLQWTTDPFSVCPNANAIRWGSTYNFRFDADRPPFSGTISIGLFRPGPPAFVLVPAVVPNPCECLGDLDDDGGLNGADIAPMVSQLLGLASPNPCADLAPPFGTGADTDDAAEFVSQLLDSVTCP